MSSLMFGCVEVPPDHLGVLIGALESQDWSALQAGGYLSAEQLSQLPLKSSLDKGSKWVGVKRIRRLERFIVLDVAVKVENQTPVTPVTERHLERPKSADPFDRVRDQSERQGGLHIFTLWFVAPTPQFQGDRPELTPHSRPLFTERLDELEAVRELEGWSTSESSPHHLPLSDLSAPRRFSSSQYRLLAGHRDAHRTSQAQLGVLTDARGESIESGWRGQINLREVSWGAST